MEFLLIQLEFQNWDFWVLVLGCTSKFLSIHKKILEFWNVALAGMLNFSQFLKEVKNWDFSILV